MTPSKKTSTPKQDIPAPVKPDGAQPASLPAAAGAEAQVPVDALVDQQDAAEQPSDTDVAPVKAEVIAEPMVTSEAIQEARYRITARHPNGFWRCGRKWHPAGEVLTLSEIGGDAVLATLQAEPMLIVAVEP